jgi:hypothetical protein
MLEFLVGKTLIEKYVNKEGFEKKDSTINDVLYILISTIIAIIAAYLAYECNAGENTATRWFITIIAFLFSGIYLLYYLVRYVFLGNNCNNVNMPLNFKKK